MRKIRRIALTEYLNAIRSKAFIIGVLGMPLIMGIALLVPQLTKDKVDLSDRRFAVVDPTGRLFPALRRAATQRNAKEIYQHEGALEAKKVQPAFLPEHYQPEGPAQEDPTLLLSDQVRSKRLFAFVVISPNLLEASPRSEPAVSYYTRTPTYAALPRWIQGVLNSEVQRFRFKRAGLDRAQVASLTRPVSMERLGLAKRTKTGETQKAEKENPVATFAVPAVFLFLLFTMVMTSAPGLLNSVLEEKIQKIVEFLVSSVTPFQLMMGKLLGALMISLTLSALYLSALGYVAYRYDVLSLVPPHLFFWFLFFLVVAVMIYGSMFLAIGAACNEIQDAQSMMFPAMMLVIIPVMTWVPILQSPDAAFARWMSFFPPATPMLMMLRMAVPPGLPWWEILAGAGVAVGFVLFCVGTAAKIFRIGILAQGQAPSFRRMFRWIVSKS